MSKLLLLVFCFSLVSCVKVDYQAFKVMSGGYKDEAIGENSYSLSYEMYGKVDPSLVLERWHIRASELCPLGYEVLELTRNDLKGESSAMVGSVLVPIAFSDPKYIGSIKCKEETSTESS
ncbi:hypothetical protein [Agaribacterium sp. ZY112]|uniref:hypothetical protein n=1 Tax=Agaribacterium sp. ZY112 TaxID=3233574 RepID=UPI003523ABEC